MTYGHHRGALRVLYIGRRSGLALCAADATRGLGIEIRVGVHTGEIEILPDDVGGIAVHATARIMAAVRPGEVLASAVTRALAEGAGFDFENRGSHELKGLENPIDLFAVSQPTE